MNKARQVLREYFGPKYSIGVGVLTALILSPLIVFFISIAGAVTTVSTDVVTGGNLQASSTLLVTGNATFYAGGSFNAATTTDSLYVGGLTQLTGATASATALVIGGAMPVFRSAANTLTVQGGLTLTNSGALTVAGTITLATGETIGNSTNNNIFVGANTVSLATTTATTTGSVWVSGKGGITTTTLQINGNIVGNVGGATRGSCLQLWQEDVTYRIYIVEGNALKVEAGNCQ